MIDMPKKKEITITVSGDVDPELIKMVQAILVKPLSCVNGSVSFKEELTDLVSTTQGERKAKDLIVDNDVLFIIK